MLVKRKITDQAGSCQLLELFELAGRERRNVIRRQVGNAPTGRDVARQRLNPRLLRNYSRLPQEALSFTLESRELCSKCRPNVEHEALAQFFKGPYGIIHVRFDSDLTL